MLADPKIYPKSVNLKGQGVDHQFNPPKTREIRARKIREKLTVLNQLIQPRLVIEGRYQRMVLIFDRQLCVRIMSLRKPNLEGKFKKWPGKSTKSYIMLDFKSSIIFFCKYLVIERNLFHIQYILLQYLKFI